jgi:hypothetical protein
VCYVQQAKTHVCKDACPCSSLPCVTLSVPLTVLPPLRSERSLGIQGASKASIVHVSNSPAFVRHPCCPFTSSKASSPRVKLPCFREASLLPVYICYNKLLSNGTGCPSFHHTFTLITFFSHAHSSRPCIDAITSQAQTQTRPDLSALTTSDQKCTTSVL